MECLLYNVARRMLVDIELVEAAVLGEDVSEGQEITTLAKDYNLIRHPDTVELKQNNI